MKQVNRRKWDVICGGIIVNVLPVKHMLYAETIVNVLWEFYNCTERVYHSTYHVIYMLEKAIEKNIDLSWEQKLAILFHDVIYIPNAASGVNELSSSTILTNIFLPCIDNGDSKTLQIVVDASNIVNDTHYHYNVDLSINDYSKIVLDLDLSNFSAPYDEFCQWGDAVVEELMCSKSQRINFLKSMLERENIYLTEEFKDEEIVARKNMERWIEENE